MRLQTEQAEQQEVEELDDSGALEFPSECLALLRVVFCVLSVLLLLRCVGFPLNTRTGWLQVYRSAF